MKPKTLVLLAVAAGCGLVAMLGIQQAMQGGQSASEPKVKVLVARAEIQPGVELTDELVGFEEKSVEASGDDPVTSFEQYEERSLMYPVLAGDIIRQSKLGKKGEFTRSRQIPAGKRVLAIAVNDTQTMSGMLRPGDRVDVLVNYQVPNMRGRPTSKSATLLKYIEVFSTDNKTVTDAASKQQEVKTKVVALVLEPLQANIIMLAQSKGSLGLSWRHPDDDEDVQGGAVDETLLSELRGLDKMDGEQNALHLGSERESANEDIAEREPREDLNNLLDDSDSDSDRDSDSEPAQPAPVALAPVKPTWKLQIYQGDAPVEQEFELPDAEPTASATGAGGPETLTEAFRWLDEQVKEGAAPAEAPTATETTL